MKQRNSDSGPLTPEPEWAAGELYSVAEAARLLKCSQRAVRQLLARNELDTALSTEKGQPGITAASLHAQLRLKGRSTGGTATQEAPTAGTVPGEADPAAPSAPFAEAPAQLANSALLVFPEEAGNAALCRPLIQVLDEVEDFRLRRGQRYRLTALLAFACAAMICGCRTYAEIAHWGQTHQTLLALCLDLNQPPSIRTLRLIFRGLDARELSSRLQHWSASIAGALPGRSETMVGTRALSWPRRNLFRTLRGRTHVTGADSLVALGQRMGLRRHPGDDGPSEWPEQVLTPVIRALFYEGRVVYLKSAPPLAPPLALQPAPPLPEPPAQAPAQPPAQPPLRADPE